MNHTGFQTMPKLELHVHLEGSVEPEDLQQLAAANRLPDAEWPLEAFEQHYQYADFLGFLGAFKFVTDHLIQPRDYARITTRLIERLHRQGAVYAEIIFSAGVVLKQKKSLDTITEALLTASCTQQAQCGIEINWIFDIARQFGVEPARQVMEATLRLRAGGMKEIVALGMGGDENSMPAMEFQEIFRKARAQGLRVALHAGETAGPSSIWEAVQGLGAERIGHGIAARHDPRLMDYLRENQIALECAPSSNVCTRAISRLEDHPLKMFLDRGLRVTLNTDDPALFRTSLLQEYQTAAQHFGLTDADFLRLNQNAFQACFASESQRQKLARQYPELAMGSVSEVD